MIRYQLTHCFATRLLLSISLVLILSANAPATAPGIDESPKREFRGAWIQVIGVNGFRDLGAEGQKKVLDSLLNTLHHAGCNAIFFQIRPSADALYPSDLEPWSKYLTGTQGEAPDMDWDPLEFMIEQCHRRGMELHAWINPYRASTEANEKFAEGHLATRRKDLFVSYGQQLYFNPGEPECREHILLVIKDIVSRYDIDGIHFDDYFYPYPIKGQTFNDENAFSLYGQGMSRDDWRRENVNTLIRQVDSTIRSVKPWLRFGISPFGIWRNASESEDNDEIKGSATNGLSGYSELYADAVKWAREGSIDYIAPQLYWKIGHPAADYETLVQWWDGIGAKGHIYIGQSIETLKEADLENPEVSQTARKIDLVRKSNNIYGNIWWPGWSILTNINGIRNDLEQRFQKYPALIPSYSHIDSIPPSPVTDIWYREKSHTIRWIASDDIDPMQIPNYYIIYRVDKGSVIDMNDSAYIWRITKDDWYVIPDEDLGKYRYAVSVVDKCWNESSISEYIEDE